MKVGEASPLGIKLASDPIDEVDRTMLSTPDNPPVQNADLETGGKDMLNKETKDGLLRFVNFVKGEKKKKYNEYNKHRHINTYERSKDLLTDKEKKGIHIDEAA